MYSVEDLLISHGYKVTQKNSNNVPVSHSSPHTAATYEKCLPTRSDSRCEIGEKRKGHSDVNGYEGDRVYSSAGGGGIRQTSARGFPCDTENQVRKQRTQDVDNGNLGDGRLPEDSLTTNSWFYDSNRGIHSQPRSEHDVSYWRRRGQDFSVLLDYADFRDPRGSAGGLPNKPEGMQRRPESALSTEEHNHEKQRRAESARAREREMALHQWRIAAERKYQSLGTEEWRPVTSMSRQPSENEVGQEQRRPRTAEGAVPPRTKTKSQSLPRMALQSESLQYFNIPTAVQDSYGSYRLNGHHTRDSHGRHLDGEHRLTDRSGAQSAPPSKPRFSRPLRPPSYEAHQQMRGSIEMLVGELAPRARDRTPLPLSRHEYFVQELGGSGAEPPGYNPPPSYRRQPLVKGGHRTYPISMGNHQYRCDPYFQGSAMTEVHEWFIRQTGMAWPDHYRDGRKSMPCRRQAYPGYSEERIGNVQYIPFDDPRVRHISGAEMDGNTLTDADKIRNIRNEIPVSLISEKSNDSAFSVTEKPFDRTEPIKSNISDSINEDSMHKEVLKETERFHTTSDQNCNRHPSDHGNTIALQMTTQQNSNSNQDFIETVTQVKKFEAKTLAENKKNSKKKLKETMFCLVSVPINMQANKGVSDPNNNEKVASPMVISVENPVVHSENQSLSKPLVSKETQIQSSSSLSNRSSPLKTEIVDAKSLNASQDNEMFYVGSWPGDQYRNQETQTGSQEVFRNTHPQRALMQTKSDSPFPKTTTENEDETDCSANYGYSMVGQKDLNPSSNSAFSRTCSNLSIMSPTLAQSASTLPSPDCQPLPRRTTSKPQTDGQEVFGQFLLKPVNRRKWDAIGELESFNKEIQDQTGKCPKVDQNIEELDDAMNNILELSNTSKEFNNRRQEPVPLHLKKETDMQSNIVQVTDMHLRQNNLNIITDSGNRGRIKEHPEYKGIQISQAKLNLDTQTQEAPVAKSNNYLNFEVLGYTDPGAYRQDIPVPKECLLRDVGLTVYTAIPDTVTSGSPTCLSPESPMLTSPSDNSEMCETLQITLSDSSGDMSRHSPEFAECTQSLTNNNSFNSKALNLKESGRESTSHIHVLKSLHCRFKANYEDDDDYFYSDYLIWSNEKTLADEHLETLLSQEKANSMPTEDLSNLYQVQYAKGIPENESIEQRAARILGIAVPVEALVVDQCDGKENGKERNSETTDGSSFMTQTKEMSSNKETQNVSRESEEVPDVSMESYGDVTEQTEISVEEDPESREDLPRAEKHSHRVSSVLELPEFPPSNLCLSLPLAEDGELALSVAGGDRKERVIAEVTEATLDNFQAYSPSPLPPSPTNDQAFLEYSAYTKEENSQSLERTVTRIALAKETEGKWCSEEDREEELTESAQENKILEEKDQYIENVVEEKETNDIASYTQHDDEVKVQEEEKVSADELIQEQSRQQLKSMALPIPQPRSGKVAKREITLPQGFMDNTMSTIEDDDNLSMSDAYDPSRVERV
ncbi:junctional cadherin 5-associated protein-like [Xyrauchen texanus]|uniref:junctional cadherin 5-associated protein-like n=1 Tax=Xyrauchen texanus TaxID=154827 RepID=UPI0022421960|nr:junctional cadherin 5-associated protein-like [Xyrauchen texanus]XP_051958288.1 junctional cadherin 5-associated protein-like [Xyrauchen texanus]XP_051958290.1 junctional cadherin 5-associated protein-like [Xyrauchen texanus]